MHKITADTLAINFAIQIAKTDPNFFGEGAALSVRAEYVADFIKNLSSRLQADIDPSVSLDSIMLR